MTEVWKLALDTPEATFDIPTGYRLLHVHQQHDEVCVWALVDPEAERTKVTIYIHGTGHSIPDDGREYVGTAHVGWAVWHVFVGRAASDE